MHGEKATIKDIVLEMREITISTDLLSGEESLSSDSEEEQELFKIDTRCDNCKTRVRVCVRSSHTGIRRLQYLLENELSFLCPGCSRNLLQHGRFQ
uniref:Protein E7 n=1 Tax=Human papillomavirus TaxID=10566 RepID=A0A1Q1PPD7_9PAPI|nr:E7 [Human papillomavirus]